MLMQLPRDKTGVGALGKISSELPSPQYRFALPGIAGNCCITDRLTDKQTDMITHRQDRQKMEVADGGRAAFVFASLLLTVPCQISPCEIFTTLTKHHGSNFHIFCDTQCA